jgi:hypothetical protein
MQFHQVQSRRCRAKEENNRNFHRIQIQRQRYRSTKEILELPLSEVLAQSGGLMGLFAGISRKLV